VPVGLVGRPGGAVSSETWEPPQPLPVPVRCPGDYQRRYLASAYSKFLISYVRNLGGILDQNVRTRKPQPLKVTLAKRSGTWQVWDLDERRIVKTVNTTAAQTLDLGTRDHDFALVFRGR